MIREVIKFLATQIIVATFHVADREPGAGSRFSIQRLLQKRNILVEELFLQILRPRRNNHSLAGADYRQQVGQRFSGTRTGFHNQVAFFLQRLLDCLRHL